MAKREISEMSRYGDCVICHKLIPDDASPGELSGEVKEARNGFAHADCYYQEFGKEIDEHPIGHPQMHR